MALIPAVDGAEGGERALDDIRGGGAYLSLRQAHALIAQQLDGGGGERREIGRESRRDLKQR